MTGEAYSSAIYFLTGLLQTAHQGFGTGQSFKRLLDTITKAGADALIQSMLVASSKQDGLLDTQAVNEFCRVDGKFIFTINEGSSFRSRIGENVITF
jgi:hypothetical protein